jgi:ligand-binding sensor domain-containing protein
MWLSYNIKPDETLFDVRAFAQSGSSNALWLAREEGIMLYDPVTKTQSRQFTPANSGLSSRYVMDLAEINDALWIVTHAGISCLKLN